MELKAGEAARNATKGEYIRSAKHRGLEFRLTDKQVDILFGSDCHYCGTPPSNIASYKSANGKFVYQGIDRIDPELDYVPFNVLPCCKDCNYAKLNMNYLDFVAWIKKAAKHLEV
jgi:hypothetical protein